MILLLQNTIENAFIAIKSAAAATTAAVAAAAAAAAAAAFLTEMYLFTHFVYKLSDAYSPVRMLCGNLDDIGDNTFTIRSTKAMFKVIIQSRRLEGVMFELDYVYTLPVHGLRNGKFRVYIAVNVKLYWCSTYRLDTFLFQINVTLTLTQFIRYKVKPFTYNLNI